MKYTIPIIEKKYNFTIESERNSLPLPIINVPTPYISDISFDNLLIQSSTSAKEHLYNDPFLVTMAL